MPYLFDPSKLNYSGNKVAVRNLISVCNSYEEIYSNLRAQLTLARDSVNSWYSVWNGAFQRTDVLINSNDPEHKQFLKQLGIILDLFYNNIYSILSTSSVPITMQYSKGTFTYYIPSDNNMFQRQTIALATVLNLEINCTPNVISLQLSTSNASTITPDLLLINYSSPESIILDSILDGQDVSGYLVNNIQATNSLFEYCSDISNSTFTNCKFNQSNFRLSSFKSCDFNSCTLKDISLNKTKLINCDLSNNINLIDTVIIGNKLGSSIASNSVIKNCTRVNSSKFDNCYLFDISNCISTNLVNSDISASYLSNCQLAICSIIGGNAINCDISNTYLKNVDVSNGNPTNNNNFISCSVYDVLLNNCILIGTNSNSLTVISNGSIRKSTLINCDLSGMYIVDCDISGCNLNNCRIINSGDYKINASSVINCTGIFNKITNSTIYPVLPNLVSVESVTIPSNNILYTDNLFRTLRLKYLVGRLNNIGCYCNTSQTYNYIDPISASNCMIGGRYFYKIGDFTTEVFSINLTNKTIGDLFKIIIGSGLPSVPKHVTLAQPLSPDDEADIYELNATPIIEIFTRLMDEINFSSGLLEDSRNLFNALL